VSSPVLVGRSGQLSALDAALAETGRGSPSAVMVGGEAGVGKSRLLIEFAERSRGTGVQVLIGGCLELGADGLPFAPFTSVLRELVRDLGAAGVAELLPGGATRELARLLPEFGEPAGADAAGAARARLFEQVLILLERLAEAGPVVLVIEDLHWADRSTRDLLAFLIRNQPSADGVLIVVTYWSDELHRAHPLRPLLADHISARFAPRSSPSYTIPLAAGRPFPAASRCRGRAAAAQCAAPAAGRPRAAPGIPSRSPPQSRPRRQ
jgi:predicted ATPase